MPPGHCSDNTELAIRHRLGNRGGPSARSPRCERDIIHILRVHNVTSMKPRETILTCCPVGCFREPRNTIRYYYNVYAGKQWRGLHDFARETSFANVHRYRYHVVIISCGPGSELCGARQWRLTCLFSAYTRGPSDVLHKLCARV